MKKWISLMTGILLIVVFVFSGCGTAEETERTPGESESSEQLQNEPVNDQEAEIPDGAEPNAQDDNKSENEAQQAVILTEYSFDAYDPEGFVVPFLSMEGSNGYRMLWDLENATVLEDGLFFTGADSGALYDMIWSGGNFFISTDKRLKCEPGIAYMPVDGFNISNFGQCGYDYNDAVAYRLANNGVEQFIPPQIPEGIYEGYPITEPAYLYVDETGRIFTVYHTWTSGMQDDVYYVDMKLIYGWTTPTGEPEDNWVCVTVPADQSVKFHPIKTDDMSFMDGKLYMGMTDDILIFDTVTEEFSCLGLWEKMGPLLAGKSDFVTGAKYKNYQRVCGSYGDVLLVRVCAFDSEIESYSYTVVFCAEEVVGVIDDNGTVYDSSLTPCSTCDCVIWKCPKDR